MVTKNLVLNAWYWLMTVRFTQRNCWKRPGYSQRIQDWKTKMKYVSPYIWPVLLNVIMWAICRSKKTVVEGNNWWIQTQFRPLLPYLAWESQELAKYDEMFYRTAHSSQQLEPLPNLRRWRFCWSVRSINVRSYSLVWQKHWYNSTEVKALRKKKRLRVYGRLL